MNTKHILTTLLLLTVALVFAGCAGEPSPTPEPPTIEAATVTAEVPTDVPAPLPTVTSTKVNIFPTIEVVVYPTIVETPFPTPDPAVTPDPTEEVLPPPGGFDRIILIRTGGPTNEDGTTADELITLNRLDKTISRGETVGALSDAAITRIGDLVDVANFFTVDALFLGAVPAEPPLPYLYSITVTAGDYERSINAQEGYMSTEIQSLIGSVLSEGQRVPKP